jgi:hypothetical protein
MKMELQVVGEGDFTHWFMVVLARASKGGVPAGLHNFVGPDTRRPEPIANRLVVDTDLMDVTYKPTGPFWNVDGMNEPVPYQLDQILSMSFGLVKAPRVYGAGFRVEMPVLTAGEWVVNFAAKTLSPAAP